MKRINITGIKIERLVENGKVPRDLKWVGEIPSSYSIHLIKNDDETKTIIALSDAFGGQISWAMYDGNIDLKGSELEFGDKDELDFLSKNYPVLLSAIKQL